MSDSLQALYNLIRLCMFSFKSFVIFACLFWGGEWLDCTRPQIIVRHIRLKILRYSRIFYYKSIILPLKGEHGLWKFNLCSFAFQHPHFLSVDGARLKSQKYMVINPVILSHMECFQPRGNSLGIYYILIQLLENTREK